MDVGGGYLKVFKQCANKYATVLTMIKPELRDSLIKFVQTICMFACTKS